MKRALIVSPNSAVLSGISEVLLRGDYGAILTQAGEWAEYDLAVIDTITPQPAGDLNGQAREMSAAFARVIGAVSRAVDQMAANHIRGSILLLTSARANRGCPGDGIYGGYFASIQRTAASLAMDYAPQGIRVNCLSLGLVEGVSPLSFQATERLKSKLPLGRVGTMEDVGNACAFLASDRAGYVTGISLRIDGAMTLATMPDNPKDCTAKDCIGFDYAAMKNSVVSHHKA